MFDQNVSLALSLKHRLEAGCHRLVLVESCTAGQIAATLGCIPGISTWLCGSLVVYRSSSKQQWLGITANVLDDPRVGPVSQVTSNLLAISALERTPEADWALAITGDLGPMASAATDGKCFLAFKASKTDQTVEWPIQLVSPPPKSTSDIAARQLRLTEATRRALEFLCEVSV
jgi:PncC family amidohydrolase